MDNTITNGPSVAFREGPGDCQLKSKGSKRTDRCPVRPKEDSVPSEEASQTPSPQLPAWQCGPCSLRR